jgi:hypothetical protein
MGPLDLLRQYVTKKTQPARDAILNKVAPNYSEFLNNSGISEITAERAAKAAGHYLGHIPEFGDHAVIDNLLKKHSEPYGYNPTVKAARSMLGARDWARRFPATDAQTMKDQAVLYQFLQGVKGLDFEGDTIDALYNKLGIDQAVAENNKIPPVNIDNMDYSSLEELFDEFNGLMK